MCSWTEATVRAVLGLTAGAMLLADAPSAQARSAEADAAYEKGKSALKAGAFQAALDRFREARLLVEGDEREVWQMLLAVALTYERMDDPGHAIETYGLFLDRTRLHASALSEKWRERRDLAARSVAELEVAAMARGGLVSVATEPAGASLLVDGRRAGAESTATTPWSVYLTPGAHEIQAILEGHAPARAEVQVEVGKLHPVSLRLAELVAPSAPPAPLGRAPNRSEGPGAGPWVLVGVGAASLGAGAWFTVETIEVQRELDSLAAEGASPTETEWVDASERFDRAERMSWIFYGSGAVLLISGASWALAASGEEEAIGLTPVLGAAGAGALVVGRF